MIVAERNQPDDLLHALESVDALEKFQALPLQEQERFSGWIAKARDDDAYWRRIDILVLAMRMAPPVAAEQKAASEPPGLWTNPIGRA